MRPKSRFLVSSVCMAAFLLIAPSAWAITDEDDLETIEILEGGHIEHCDDAVDDFETAFECGDEIFGTRFNTVDGVGANVGDGGRFTRVPRADLDGPGEWASHTPMRATGPNAGSCESCHVQPVGDGAGEASLANVRDPFHTGDPGQFIQRQVPHLFGIGALQLLAQEMNTELEAIVAEAAADACDRGKKVSRRLRTKEVEFGWVEVKPRGGRRDRYGSARRGIAQRRPPERARRGNRTRGPRRFERRESAP